jgi:hypothetical protein
LVSSCGTAVPEETVVVAYVVGAFSIHGVVVAGVSEALVLHLLGKGRPKHPSLCDAMRNSSVESSIMALLF